MFIPVPNMTFSEEPARGGACLAERRPWPDCRTVQNPAHLCGRQHHPAGTREIRRRKYHQDQGWNLPDPVGQGPDGGWPERTGGQPATLRHRQPHSPA